MKYNQKLCVAFRIRHTGYFEMRNNDFNKWTLKGQIIKNGASK